MWTLLSLYAWTIAAGSLAAICLALIGSQLAGRGQSVQCLVVSQGSSLGVTCGMALATLISSAHAPEAAWLPLGCSLAFGAAFHLICERWVPAAVSSRDTFYIGLFAGLLSITYSVTSLVPSLESHMVATFFGDLAVISEEAARFMAFFAGVALVLLMVIWKAVSEQSFDKAIFGTTLKSRREKHIDALFVSLSVAMLCLAIQYMGLLFVISSLFLPSVFVGLFSRGLRPFTGFLVVTAAVGSVAGFVFSLWQEKWPTVPAIVLAYCVVGMISGLAAWMVMDSRHCVLSSDSDTLNVP